MLVSKATTANCKLCRPSCRVGEAGECQLPGQCKSVYMNIPMEYLKANVFQGLKSYLVLLDSGSPKKGEGSSS